MDKPGKESRHKILEHLEGVIRQLGCELRYEGLPGKGGLAKYGGKEYFIIHRELSIDEKIEVICGSLKAMDLSGIYLLPAVRKMLGEEGFGQDGHDDW